MNGKAEWTLADVEAASAWLGLDVGELLGLSAVTSTTEDERIAGIIRRILREELPPGFRLARDGS